MQTSDSKRNCKTTVRVIEPILGQCRTELSNVLFSQHGHDSLPDYLTPMFDYAFKEILKPNHSILSCNRQKLEQKTITEIKALSDSAGNIVKHGLNSI